MTWPQWERWAQQHEFLLTNANLINLSSECLTYNQQRQTLNPQDGTISQEDLVVTWWQVSYTEPLPSWEDQLFFLLGIDIYSRCGLSCLLRGPLPAALFGLLGCCESSNWVDSL